jgi:hypothetical protein
VSKRPHTTENKAKKRNLSSSVKMCRQAGEVDDRHLRQRRDFTDHRLTVCIPGTDHQAVKRLVEPIIDDIEQFSHFGCVLRTKFPKRV